MCSREGERFWPKGICCLINWASGSLMNRLPATFCFPAVLNYKFRYVKYFNMLNITSGNSPEILTNRRGGDLVTGKWFCVGIYNAMWLKEALLSLTFTGGRLNPGCRRGGLHFCRSRLTPETRTLDNTRLLLSLAAFHVGRYSSTESKMW